MNPLNTLAWICTALCFGIELIFLYLDEPTGVYLFGALTFLWGVIGLLSLRKP